MRNDERLRTIYEVMAPYNNVADNTGDNAAGNEPAEEQEVENTDGE